MAATVDRLCQETILDSTLISILKVTAKLVEDNTPEAREASRTIILRLRSAYIASGHVVPVEVAPPIACYLLILTQNAAQATFPRRKLPWMLADHTTVWICVRQQCVSSVTALLFRT